MSPKSRLPTMPGRAWGDQWGVQGLPVTSVLVHLPGAGGFPRYERFKGQNLSLVSS